MNMPYLHVLAGLGFSFLQLGHLAIPVPVNCLHLKHNNLLIIIINGFGLYVWD